MSRKFWLQVTRSYFYRLKFKAWPFDTLRARSKRSGKVQNPKWLVGLVVILLTFSLAKVVAHAQQRSGSFRVGVLEPGSRPRELTTRPGCNIGFREGMSELGWIEGQNLQL